MVKKIKTLLICFVGIAGFSSTVAFGQDFSSRDSLINDVLDTLTIDKAALKPFQDSVKIKGSLRASFGIDSDGASVFRRANADLNERNWRILDYRALNRYENTYDPAVYSRLKMELDAKLQDAVSMHMNIVVDPWSFTAKSHEQVVAGVGGDSMNVQYLYTAASGYTLNRTLRSNINGDSLNLDEYKINGNMVPAVQVRSGYNNIYNIPAAKLEYAFNPLREMWFDIKTGDKGKIRIFPMAYQDQALTSDDPLHLSNNMIYWEPSPWINSWAGGNFNAGGPNGGDFTKGRWDDTLAYAVRDSDGLRLTALRGLSIDMKPTEDTSLKAVVAAPKTIWDDYSNVSAIPGSLRLKQFLSENLFIGTTDNMHLGLVNGRMDAKNYVESVDTGFLVAPGVKVAGQASTSQSIYDMTSPTYEVRRHGNAYYVAVEANTSPNDMLGKDYFGEIAPKGEKAYAKTRAFFGKMDNDFESSLSNYHATRKDSYWSRHLTFYPSTYKNLPGGQPTNSEYDLDVFAVGNGLDYGRSVVGWRGDVVLLEGLLKGMADIRTVDKSSGGHVETVARTQWTYKANDQLTAKALLVDQELPKTTAGKDPFITNSQTGLPVDNAEVPGGQDPSVKTASFGARYQVTDKVAVNGVWEHTNDVTAGSDNFPQGVMNGAWYGQYLDDGKYYRQANSFVYGQGKFDQAPYNYFNILKAGLEFKPLDPWMIYVDYTHNPNKFAGNIDDNVNHFGIETSYVPSAKWGFFGRYTFTRMYDLVSLVNNSSLDYQAHNNAFLEARYLQNKDTKLSLEYGVGPAYNTSVSSTNPTLAYYNAPVVDTQHIIRMSYEKKF